MGSQLSEFPIRDFGTLASLQETTDIGGKLTEAKNCKLRPFGGISGPPRYFRLWAIGSVQNIYSTLDALTHPSGSGTLSDSDLTVAVRIYRYGVNFLLLYSMPDRKARGFFYLGRDNSYTGPVDFDTGPPSYEVLAVGLDRSARWYGKRAYTQIFLNNGVDNGVVVQLNRTKTPGKWRIAASNDRPVEPIISLTAPGNSTLVQSFWTIPGSNSFTFTADVSSDTFTTPAPHNFVNGTAVRLTTTGTLPAPLATGTTYYVAAAVGTTFKLTTSPGSGLVNITTVGTGTHTVAVFGATRAGSASLTFTANEGNFPGVSGNNKIKVNIVFSSYGGAISSTLTGSGSVADPYIYTIFTTTSGNSTDAIVTFVNLDAKVLSILSASKSGADSTSDTANYGPEFLAQGSGTGQSAGFTNKTATVYLRYFDSGNEFLGYEGISSEISNTIIIDANTNSDIRVSVPVSPGAGDGRFNQIRVYLQFGEGLAAQWNLMDADNPIINTSRSGQFVPDLTSNFVFTFSQTRIVTTNASTDFITNFDGSAAPPNNTPVIFASSPPPSGGLTGFVVYYVVQASGSSFKVSLSEGGSPVNITANTSTAVWRLVAHSLAPGNGILLAGSALPSPLTASEYFVRNPTPYSFQLSESVDGSIVDITAGGNSPTYTLTRQVVQLGTTTPIGQIMSVDQNRPLPHKVTTIANEQTWRGSVTGFQDRLYVSKPATNDELAPEGANAEAYERVESPNGTTGTPRMTALYSDGFKIHVHTADGVTLIDPTDPSKRYSPPVVCGAINQSALVPWPGGLIYYLGADFQIYTISGLRYGKQQVEFAARDAASYVLDRTSVDAALDNPDRVFAFPDVNGQMLWFFLPSPNSEAVAITGLASTEVITSADRHGLRLLDAVIFPTLTGGTGLTAGTTIYYVKTVPNATTFTVSATPGGNVVNITTNITAGTFAKTKNRLGFVYDFEAKGILGEYDYPKVYDLTLLEPSRPEMVFADEDGNLFFWDTRNQLDHGDNYGAQPMATKYSINTLPPVQFDGYGMVDYNDGTGTSRYYQAATCIFTTGYIDIGRAANRKAFAGLIWATVQGSRGLVKVQFIAMNTDMVVTKLYGDLTEFGFQQCHKILQSMNATAVKVKFTVIYAEQSAWTVRNMAMLYRGLRQL